MIGIALCVFLSFHLENGRIGLWGLLSQWKNFAVIKNVSDGCWFGMVLVVLPATLPSKSSLSLIKDAKIEAQPPQDQKLKVRIGGNHLLTQSLHIIYSKLLNMWAGYLEQNSWAKNSANQSTVGLFCFWWKHKCVAMDAVLNNFA